MERKIRSVTPHLAALLCETPPKYKDLMSSVERRIYNSVCVLALVETRVPILSEVKGLEASVTDRWWALPHPHLDLTGRIHIC